MPKTLATQRTLKALRKEGYQCAIVEKWIPPRGKMKFGVRQDVWGFGDLLVCRPAKFASCRICFGQGKIPPYSHPIECRTCKGTGKIHVSVAVIALIQCFPNSGGAGFAEHRRKIRQRCNPEVENWLLTGGRIFLVGWRKVGYRWRVKVEELNGNQGGLEIAAEETDREEGQRTGHRESSPRD